MKICDSQSCLSLYRSGFGVVGSTVSYNTKHCETKLRVFHWYARGISETVDIFIFSIYIFSIFDYFTPPVPPRFSTTIGLPYTVCTVVRRHGFNVIGEHRLLHKDRDVFFYALLLPLRAQETVVHSSYK